MISVSQARLPPKPFDWHLPRFMLVVTTLFTLGVGLVTFSHLLNRPYIGYTFHPQSGEVIKVAPNSPAEQAGVRLGDILTKIEGVPQAEAHSLYRDKRVGDTVRYEFLRSEKQITIDVLLARPPPSESANLLAIVLLGCAFWLLGITVFYSRQADIITSHFLLFCVCGAAAIWVLPLTLFRIEWAVQVIYITLLICGAAFFHFHLHFPRQAHLTQGLVWTVDLIGLGLLLLSILVGPQALNAWSDQAGLPPRLPGHLVRLYFIITVFFSLALLATGYRSGSGATRRKVRLVVFGTLIGFTPLLLLLISEVLGGVGLPYYLTLIGLVAMPLAYCLSLNYSDLMVVESRLFRALVYLTGGLLLLATYLGLVTLGSWFFTGQSVAPLIGALSSLIVAVSFSPVQQGVQRALNRLFYGKGYDYLGVLADSLRTMSLKLDEQEIMAVLTERIPTAMGASQACLWIVENEKLSWRGSTFGIKPERESVPLDEVPISANEHLKAAPALDWLPDNSRWLVPLVLSGELQGLWVVSSRHAPHDESFTPVDLQLMKAVAREAALVIKVINLVDDLRAELERSEADRQELRQAYTRLVEVREAEQKRIARELHDEVIQTVYGFTLFIQRARQQARLKKTEELGQQLAELQRQTVEISRTTRRICHDLRPDALKQLGLSGALRSLAKKSANRGELDVKTVINPPNIHLNEETSIALYRIVQESLNNVIKHAQANLVTVHLSVTDVAIKLMIEDDGIGFDPASVEGKRLGLIGIRERVRALDGTLTIDSQIGKGTTLRVQI